MTSMVATLHSLRSVGFDFSKWSKLTRSQIWRVNFYTFISFFFFKKGTTQHSNSVHGLQSSGNLGSNWHLLGSDLERKTVYLSLNFLKHKKRLIVYLMSLVGKWYNVIWSFIFLAFIIMTKKENDFCLWHVNCFWKYFPNRSLFTSFRHWYSH